jgi:hypothetical protein
VAEEVKYWRRNYFPWPERDLQPDPAVPLALINECSAISLFTLLSSFQWSPIVADGVG